MALRKKTSTTEKKGGTIEKKSSLVKKKTPIKVFISYSHDDSEFKGELLSMLASLERNNVIRVLHDRQIEGGADWFPAIQKAMKTSKMAILLVSQNFLNSRFIQSEEVPVLLSQRIQHGMRVIPIIVRPCLWQDDPILSSIQVLPKDGKPIISFSNAHGERDQAWVEIAQSIGKWAKAMQRSK